MFVGIADTFVVSFSSEAAVSAVTAEVFHTQLLRLLFGKIEADVF